jgi:predicted nucleic acid-binding protein
MPSEFVFVDTNILVYAHDRLAGQKYDLAKEKVLWLWQQPQPPAISVQVLQELYVTLLRRKLPIEATREFVKDYLKWRVIPNDSTLLLQAMSVTDRFQISLWDSLIIAAALRAGASEVWSEDLNDGQDYGGVKVVNPLK